MRILFAMLLSSFALSARAGSPAPLAPEEQIRALLHISPGEPSSVEGIRSKVLTYVSLGEPRQNVDHTMARYGLGRSAAPCSASDFGTRCSFQTKESEAEGGHLYLIEFIYSRETLQDVWVSLFTKGRVKSTSTWYTDPNVP